MTIRQAGTPLDRILAALYCLFFIADFRKHGFNLSSNLDLLLILVFGILPLLPYIRLREDVLIVSRVFSRKRIPYSDIETVDYILPSSWLNYGKLTVFPKFGKKLTLTPQNIPAVLEAIAAHNPAAAIRQV